jgi:3',5'-cyclic AMP phosphodiesterase CpdA
MKFSILHISDLHRDLTNELGNAPLLESLVRDVEQRYASNDPPIPKPAICIVSGDLVYGAKAGSQQATQFLALDIVTKGTDASVVEIARRICGTYSTVLHIEDISSQASFITFFSYCHHRHPIAIAR